MPGAALERSNGSAIASIEGDAWRRGRVSKPTSCRATGPLRCSLGVPLRSVVRALADALGGRALEGRAARRVLSEVDAGIAPLSG